MKDGKLSPTYQITARLNGKRVIVGYASTQEMAHVIASQNSDRYPIINTYNPLRKTYTSNLITL